MVRGLTPFLTRVFIKMLGSSFFHIIHVTSLMISSCLCAINRDKAFVYAKWSRFQYSIVQIHYTFLKCLDVIAWKIQYMQCGVILSHVLFKDVCHLYMSLPVWLSSKTDQHFATAVIYLNWNFFCFILFCVSLGLLYYVLFVSLFVFAKVQYLQPII